MRRNDKEISDRTEIERILVQSQVCHIAMHDDRYPYIVPVNYVWLDNCIYIHSALEGKKISLLKRYPAVCVEIDVSGGVIEKPNACVCSFTYESIIAFGTAHFVKQVDEKRKALRSLCFKHLKKEYSFNEKDVESVSVIRIEIDEITAKRSPQEAP
jgi:hypothetical protein